MTMIRGKSPKSVAYDISEGYIAVNPLFLKPLDTEALKELYWEIQKVQSAIRSEKFPHSDIMAIRKRNVRLSKLHQASMVIRNFARERRTVIL
jgi:hypothetical protein